MYFNDKIDKLKSTAKKINGKYTTRQIRNLLQRRENKITHYFNLVVKWLSEQYKNKRIIVGYNLNWKKNVNMGATNNQRFYQIPFCKLINKLESKMKEKGKEIVMNEESYTSKCDSLALEDIKKQEKYSGERKKRGLFQSSMGLLINADLNGAINIMRKYLARKGMYIDDIKGDGLFNPKRINVFHDVSK